MTVDQAVEQIIANAAAQASAAGQDGQDCITARTLELRSRLVDAAGLKAIPPPEPLIAGWLYRDSLAWLGGKPGHGKTFVAVDLACCVATGRDWHGCAVTRGTVLYLIAESSAGLGQRVGAWELSNGTRADGVKFLPVAVQMTSPQDVAAFARLLAEEQPDLTIIDTQARVTVGLEENSARDMGLYVAALEQLRQASHGCVLSAHHEPRAGENLRGSTALEGAATTIVRASKDGSVIELTNPKQKDAPGQPPLRLGLIPIAGSAILSHETVGLASIATESEHTLLTVLRDTFGTAGASRTQLKEAAGIPRSSFYRALNTLVSKGAVIDTGTSARSCYVPASEHLQEAIP